MVRDLNHIRIIERLKLKEHLKHFSDLDCESVMIVAKYKKCLLHFARRKIPKSGLESG